MTISGKSGGARAQLPQPTQLTEEERRRVTHVEGGRAQRAPGNDNWQRIQQLADRFEGGAKVGASGPGPAASGGAGGGGGGGGGGGAMPLDGLESVESAPGMLLGNDSSVEFGDGAAKVWSTWKMFDDEERMRQQDVAEMLQRLREEAQNDRTRVAQFLRDRPELVGALSQAITPTSAFNGWATPGADGGLFAGPSSVGGAFGGGGGSGGGGGGGGASWG